MVADLKDMPPTPVEPVDREADSGMQKHLDYPSRCIIRAWEDSGWETADNPFLSRELLQCDTVFSKAAGVFDGHVTPVVSFSLAGEIDSGWLPLKDIAGPIYPTGWLSDDSSTRRDPQKFDRNGDGWACNADHYVELSLTAP